MPAGSPERYISLFVGRIQGDLIGAFEAVNGISCLDSIFNIIRSGFNLVSKSMGNSSSRVISLRRKFLSERIVKICPTNCLFVSIHLVAWSISRSILKGLKKRIWKSLDLTLMPIFGECQVLFYQR